MLVCDEDSSPVLGEMRKRSHHGEVLIKVNKDDWDRLSKSEVKFFALL